MAGRNGFAKRENPLRARRTFRIVRTRAPQEEWMQVVQIIFMLVQTTVIGRFFV